MNKKKKYKHKKKLLTKQTIFFWNKEIIIVSNIFMIIFICAVPLIGMIIQICRKEPFYLNDMGILLFAMFGFSILPADLVFLLPRFYNFYFLHCEESYMHIQFNEAIGNVSIHDCDNYMTNDWFVVPYKAYIFHRKYINDIGEFQYISSKTGSYYKSMLYLADKKTWIVYLDNRTKKEFIKWYKNIQ